MRHTIASLALLAAVAASAPAAPLGNQDAKFFQLHAADADFLAPAAEAPVLADLQAAASEAMAMGKKAGYNHLWQRIKEIVNARHAEVPKPFFYGMLLVRDLGWYQAHNKPPFKHWGDGRQTLVDGVRFAAENADQLLGEATGSTQAVLKMSRFLTAGKGTRFADWNYAYLAKYLTSEPGIVPDENLLAVIEAVNWAAHGHAKGEVWRSLAETMKDLETEVPSTQRYFELAIEAGDRVSNHFHAYVTIRGFLQSARLVPNAWGTPAIHGLIEAANTYDEYGWIQYPIGSEEPFRRQIRRVARFLAEGEEGFPAYCAMLAARTADGKYYFFQNWTVWKMLQSLDLELVPEEHRSRVNLLRLNGSTEEMRAFLDEVTASAS